MSDPNPLLTTDRPVPEARGTAVTSAGPSTRPSFLARRVLARLERISSGTLAVVVDGSRHTFGDRPTGWPPAEVVVEDQRFWSAVALRGGVGAGEAYARGWWTSDDPTAVVQVLVKNEEVLSGLDSGLARLSKPLLSLYHAMRGNTEKGSRENIAAHYDLSNEFFALFLDETMTYSCGIFDETTTDLREASIAKIDRLCRKLELGPEDHLLEIGTGWGAFAIHAASTYGCRVTTTTISREQHDLAAARIREAGLEHRITLKLEDYRRLTGTYDKIVSVEMIEAVGDAYFDTFFQCCAALLKPEGRMALQAITIADQHYEKARRSVDFIKRHIFPGCCIPSVTALLSSTTAASDLRMVHLEDIGPHYARTLHLWHRNLRARWDEARALGFDDTFLRLWEFYLCYCEGGFAERRLSDVQVLFERPACRDDHVLPRLTSAPA